LINIDWVTFTLKLVLVPVFIGMVSLAGRHWGPTISGWLIGLPLTSGPVAFFLALEQGNIFAATASQAMMIGIISVSVFSLAYTRLATRTFWLPSVVAGFCVWVACTFMLDNINVPSLISFPLVLVVIATSFLLIPRLTPHSAPLSPPRWEIPARMFSATVLVLLITAIAQILGPKLTGLLTPIPIYATVLAVFTHRYEAAQNAVRLLRGVVAGSTTATIFLLIISSTITSWGVGFAFISAIAVSLATHTAIFQFLRSHN
jgi:hypothetical protein